MILPKQWERLQYQTVRVFLRGGRRIERAVLFRHTVFKVSAGQPLFKAEDIEDVRSYFWKQCFDACEFGDFKRNENTYREIVLPESRFYGNPSVDVKLKDGRIFRQYWLQNGDTVIGKIIGGQFGQEQGNIPFGASDIAQVQYTSRAWFVPALFRGLFGYF